MVPAITVRQLDAAKLTQREYDALLTATKEITQDDAARLLGINQSQLSRALARARRKIQAAAI